MVAMTGQLSTLIDGELGDHGQEALAGRSHARSDQRDLRTDWALEPLIGNHPCGQRALSADVREAAAARRARPPGLVTAHH